MSTVRTEQEILTSIIEFSKRSIEQENARAEFKLELEKVLDESSKAKVSSDAGQMKFLEAMEIFIISSVENATLYNEKQKIALDLLTEEITKTESEFLQ